MREIAGERAQGADGWVYKVGRRVGSTGAADPSGPFGTGRKLRAGQKVLWFWCVKDAVDACQRTLEIAAPRTVAPGAAFRRPCAATTRTARACPSPASRSRSAVDARPDASGTATVTAPAAAGALTLRAEQPGLVQAFPRKVTVG